MASGKNKVLLVDDHALFRRGLAGLLAARAETEVSGEAADGVEFLEMLPDTEADVVLLDIDMPRMGGIEAAAKALEIRPDIKIITLSMHGDEDYYFRMVSQGVKGFLLKNSDIDELVNAICVVAEGGSYFSQELLQNLVGSLKALPQQAEEESDQLSERELEVLLLVCLGLSNQEIADKLFISKRTVDKHRANILAKTGCRNTANLVAYAIKNGLVEI